MGTQQILFKWRKEGIQNTTLNNVFSLSYTYSNSHLSFFVYLHPFLIAHIGNLKFGGLLEVFIVVIVQSLSWVWLFFNPMDCSPPGSSVHGILQARILEWVAISLSREFIPPRNQTCVSCIDKLILYNWATWEALLEVWGHICLQRFHYLSSLPSFFIFSFSSFQTPPSSATPHYSRSPALTFVYIWNLFKLGICRLCFSWQLLNLMEIYLYPQRSLWIQVAAK